MSERKLIPSLNIVELTGRMASGKSVAASVLRNLGVTVVDVDAVARSVLQPGMPAYEDITSIWPELKTDEGVDRQLLRELTIASEDNSAVEELENIIHPCILSEAVRLLNESKGLYAVLERPALKKKSSIQPHYRLVIDQQNSEDEIKRARERSIYNGDELTREQIVEILKRQMNRSALLDIANGVIKNTAGKDELKEKVKSWHNRYIESLY